MQADFAIIGGTGVYDPVLLESAETVDVDTNYGSVQMQVGSYHGRQVAFLARHGQNHQTPPHRINYRANIAALAQLGVKQALATTAVGALTTSLPPGSVVIPDDFLDFTKNRANTFFDEGNVVHIDVSDPFCPNIRSTLIDVARDSGQQVHAGGTYVCTEGPRFESPAEVRFFASIGGTVVGMTGLPEAVLAKEAQICYATVCLVSNFATGLTGQPLTHQEVVEQMATLSQVARQLLFRTISRLDGPATCVCQQAVSGQVGLSQNTTAV